MDLFLKLMGELESQKEELIRKISLEKKTQSSLQLQDYQLEKKTEELKKEEKDLNNILYLIENFNKINKNQVRKILVRIIPQSLIFFVLGTALGLVLNTFGGLSTLKVVVIVATAYGICLAPDILAETNEYIKNWTQRKTTVKQNSKEKVIAKLKEINETKESIAIERDCIEKKVGELSTNISNWMNELASTETKIILLEQRRAMVVEDLIRKNKSFEKEIDNNFEELTPNKETLKLVKNKQEG